MVARKILIFTTMAIAVFFSVGYTANENSGQSALKKHYTACIDEFIIHCEYKEASMFNSKLKNIRSAAALACLKAAFFKTHKNMLIEDLITAEIGTKPYKIQYHLNSKFFSVLRTATMTSLQSPLLYSAARHE